MKDGGLVEGARQLGILLNAGQVDQFLRYLEALEEGGHRVNLTSIKGESIINLHFLDSLTGALFLPAEGGTVILDVGSGAGFPGVPLKIYRPDLVLHILDSSQKRLAFLEGLLKELKIQGVELYHGRAEEYGHRPGFRESYSWVTARALAPLAVLLELCLPFCRRGGLFCAYKGPEAPKEAALASHALQVLEGRLVKQHALTLPGDGSRRNLLLIEKTGDTPARFPRRPGIPGKRPLGPGRQK